MTSTQSPVVAVEPEPEEAAAPSAPPTEADVRVLVQEEGRSARNLLVFNVLVDNKSPSSVLRSSRRQAVAAGRSGRPGPPEERAPVRTAARKRGRARSVSAGRGSAKDLHARYWTFLFENLRRAVDEIYQTCETDDSVLECKETIMILERCTQDFRNLIEWLKIKWEYDHTPKPQRPASVAWEIRKTSPGKLPLALVEKRLIGDHSRKHLTFEERHSRPGSASSGGGRPEPDAAVGRYLEQALRSALTSPETEGETGQPPPGQGGATRTPEQDGTTRTLEEGGTTRTPEQGGTAQTPEQGATTRTTEQGATTRTPEQDGTTRTLEQDGTARSPSLPVQPAGTPPQPQQPAAEAGLDAGQKPTRVRTAARPRGGRVVAPGMRRSEVSPRGGGGGGGRGAPSRPVSAAGGPAGKPEQRIRQAQSQPAGRGATTAGSSSSTSCGRPERSELTGRRSRGAARPAGPPPSARSAAAGRRAAGPGGLQRSATVCSTEPRPPPARLYSSCVQSRSNSSLSSTASSSGHSWADRVKGVAPASSPAGPAASPEAAVAASAEATAATSPEATAATAAPDDDGGGWETVKSRSRSRLSASQGQSRAPLQRKGSAEAACGGGVPYRARSRFHQPTSAVSLPSLTPCAGLERAERRPSGVSERAVRGAARRAGRAAPPPPAQADSHALRRSRERVPGRPTEEQIPGARPTEEQIPGARPTEEPALGARPTEEPTLAARPTEEPAPGARPTEEQIPGARPTEEPTLAARPTEEPTLAARPTEEPQAAVVTAQTGAQQRRSGEATTQGGADSSSDPALLSNGPQHSSNISTSSCGNLEATPLSVTPVITTDAATVTDSNTDTAEAASTEVIAATVTTVTTAATSTASATSATSALSICIPTVGAASRAVPSPPPGPAAVSPPARYDPTSPPAPRGLSSPILTPRDLRSPELDEDSVDEEMVQAEKALQSAIVQERHLEQQLAETESCVIEVDTETDGESTSIDTECEGDGSGPPEPPSRTLIEEQYAPELENLSWGDRMDMLEELEELSSRTPGRGLQMHEKLSSPSRKKALSETIRLHQERQQKASRMRRSLMDQKTQKLSEISIKIEEVRQQKEQLLEQRRLVLERKMARAEEKRRKHLQDIVRRAHDEEEKAKEIAFINELEAKNKRHEFYSQIQTQEARLAGIQEERQRRLEEKAAKEAAVEEKRRALEQERLVKLEELKQKRQERMERIHREQRDKEKERLEMAREKQRDRDERLSALHAAQQATAEELQRRIRHKQQESARRHEENMVQIRQRALELSVRSAAAGGDDTTAQLAPYDTKKMCTLCNVLIGSEVYLLSHLRGRQHRESVRAAAGSDLAGEELLLYNLRHITDAAPHHIINMTFDKERHKTLKKRCKKIKARMLARQQEYDRGGPARPAPLESPHRAKLLKCTKELNKVLSGQGRGPWPNAAVSALDRTLGELLRVLDKGVTSDQLVLCAAGGLQVLSDIVSLIQEELTRDVEIVPARTVSNVSRVLAGACKQNPDNCLHMINSNMVGAALDLLMTRLARLSTTCAASGGVRCDPGAAALMQLTSVLLTALTSTDMSHQRWSLLQDVCSYLVCVGTVDKISSFFSCVQGGPDSEPHLADFLTQSLGLLRAMAALLTARHPQSRQSKESVDRTGLIATLQVTQLCGIVSLLYGALLRHHSPAQRRCTPPPPLDPATLLLAAEALSALLQMAQLDLHMFQMCLGFEGRSVEFRHVTSYLLWYCSHHEQPALLRLVIQTTGYFAARCYDNQMVIQKGNMPTVLQQLLTLPFAHFSDPALTVVLFPTLLACCRDNAQTRAILEQELSFQILEEFVQQEASRSCHLVRVLLAADEEGASVRSGSVASST